MATTPPNENGTPIWASSTLHAYDGGKVGEEREGEVNIEASKYPSFAEVLKKEREIK